MENRTKAAFLILDYKEKWFKGTAVQSRQSYCAVAGTDKPVLGSVEQHLAEAPELPVGVISGGRSTMAAQVWCFD